MNSTFKFVVTFISLTFFTIGLVLLGRVYFQENPITISVNSEDENPYDLKPNTFLPVNKNVLSSESQREVVTWGETLTSSFAPKLSKDNAAFLIERENEKLILSLKNENLETLYQLPVSADKIKIYQSNLASYIDTIGLFSQQSLVLLDGETSIQIPLNTENSRYIDYFFNINTKTFYISSIDKQDNFFIDTLNLNGKTNNFYTSRLLSSSTKFLNIYDNSTLMVQDYLTKECFGINLVTKIINSEKCSTINQSEYLNNIIENENILLFNTNTQTDTFSLTKNVLNSYKNYFLNSTEEVLYFLKENEGKISLNSFNLNTKNEQVRVEDVSSLKVQQLFIIEGEIYTIINDGELKILKYSQTNQTNLKEYSISNWFLVNTPKNITSLKLLNSQAPVFN